MAEEPRAPWKGFIVTPGVSALSALVVAGVVTAVHAGHALLDAASRADDDPRLLAASVTRVDGTHLPYSLILPDTGWRAFGAETLEEVPDADAWLRRSDIGAELIVVPRTGVSRDTSFLELEAFAMTRLTESGGEVLRLEDWPAAHGGRVVHCYLRYLDVGETEVLLGLWRRFGVSYSVMITVPNPSYDDLLPEARAILDAFDPGPE